MKNLEYKLINSIESTWFYPEAEVKEDYDCQEIEAEAVCLGSEPKFIFLSSKVIPT